MRLSRCCGQHGARARAPGSAVAFGKLHGLLNSKALSLPGKNVANLAMAGGSLAGAAALFTTGEPCGSCVWLSSGQLSSRGALLHATPFSALWPECTCARSFG